MEMIGRRVGDKRLISTIKHENGSPIVQGCMGAPGPTRFTNSVIHSTMHCSEDGGNLVEKDPGTNVCHLVPSRVKDGPTNKGVLTKLQKYLRGVLLLPVIQGLSKYSFPSLVKPHTLEQGFLMTLAKTCVPDICTCTVRIYSLL